MKNLIEYLGDTVILTDTEGKTYTGKVNFYNPPADNNSNLAEIVLETEYRSITFLEDEIADMKKISM